MTLLLSLFFGSLAGIILMIMRKLIFTPNTDTNYRQVDIEVLPLFEIPHITAVKDLTVKGARKYGYAALVLVLKFYVKLTNMLKEQYDDIYRRLMNTKDLTAEEITREKNKASKFLEMISDYKHKIRSIKHKIAEEEKKL